MRKKTIPIAARTPIGAKDATRTPSCHTRNHPSNESPLWEACRHALDADAALKAQAAARLEAAALKLGGFSLTEKGDRWVTHCPHCGGKVELYSDNSGVGVVG